MDRVNRVVGWAVWMVALWVGSAAAQPATSAPAECRPAITFNSLMGSVGIEFGSGRLMVEKLYAVCLPMPAGRADANYPYDPEGGARLTMAVRTADGQTRDTYVWRAEHISGLWELSQSKVISGVPHPGAYTIHLEIDGKVYGDYPFTVKGGKIQLQGRQVRESTDPMLLIVDYMYGGRYTSWWISRTSAKGAR